MWEDYVREARRFSDRDLANIIGEDSARVWKFNELPEDIGQWERNQCLIIGEFIRRYHARLAHEISIYGFPGLPPVPGESHFPAIH
jgi:molecular chaperone HtpG